MIPSDLRAGLGRRLGAKDYTPEIARVKLCLKMSLKVHGEMPLEIHNDF